MVIDFRFAEINGEIWALEMYLDLVERSLKSLADSERARLLKEYSHEGAPFESHSVQLAFQLAEEMESQVLPRLLLGPCLISLWSLFESSVVEIADYIRRQRDLDLTLNDLRGSFLARAEKYFRDGLHYDFSLEGDCWRRLSRIAEVRHAFAHANGRLSAVPETLRPSILQIVDSGEGLSFDGDFLVPSVDFVRESFAYVKSTLEDLMNRVRAGFSHFAER
jgi:hypothetical protein